MADSQDPILKAVERYYSVPRSSDGQTTYCLTFESVADFSRELLGEACKAQCPLCAGKSDSYDSIPIRVEGRQPPWRHKEKLYETMTERCSSSAIREHFNLGGNKS